MARQRLEAAIIQFEKDLKVEIEDKTRDFKKAQETITAKDALIAKLRLEKGELEDDRRRLIRHVKRQREAMSKGIEDLLQDHEPPVARARVRAPWQVSPTPNEVGQAGTSVANTAEHEGEALMTFSSS